MSARALGLTHSEELWHIRVPTALRLVTIVPSNGVLLGYRTLAGSYERAHLPASLYRIPGGSHFPGRVKVTRVQGMS